MPVLPRYPPRCWWRARERRPRLRARPEPAPPYPPPPRYRPGPGAEIRPEKGREFEAEVLVGLLRLHASAAVVPRGEEDGADAMPALDVLDQYDHQTLEIEAITQKELFQITYPVAIEAIKGLKNKFGGSSLFGNEKDESFQGSLAAVYQTFGGKDVYPSVEEKAANLLYFIIKNHSFSDGNKRIAPNQVNPMIVRKPPT